MERNRKQIFLIWVAFGLLLLLMSCSLPGADGGTQAGTGTEAGNPVTANLPAGAPPPTHVDGAPVTWVPGGTFQMGSPAGDTAAEADEFPQHTVSVSGFWIYTAEVTNAMYAACVQGGGCDSPQVLESGPTSHYLDPAYAGSPVVGVDWNMAYNYCQWAGGRLPSEAEWELASRGTESLRYPWGTEDPTCDRVNMFGCFTPPGPLAGGSFPDGFSPYELQDMSGNVWEWVNDWYAADYYSASPAADPLGPSSGEEKVVRGGGWRSGAENVRAAARLSANLYRMYEDVGFRCVAMGDPALPDGYAVPEDRHEGVPPGDVEGGDSVEDPDDPEGWWWTWSRGAASCPDEAGMISVSFPLEASILQDYTLASGYGGDVPFDCTYDAADHMLRCTGPAPEVTEGDPLYHFLLCAETFDACNFADAWRAEVMREDGCAADAPTRDVRTEVICGDWQPVFRFVYAPVPPAMTSITSGGVPLDCYFNILDEAGNMMSACINLPGEADDPLPVTACFEDGECFDEIIILPRCGEPPGTGPHGFWALLDVGCHSETQIYLLFDTPFSELVPGVPYTYSVTDGETTYACDLHPTIPGRVYCSGTLPSAPGPLVACFSVNGGPETCTTFDDFVPRVPICEGTEPEEPEEPGQPVVPCSSYGNPISCENNGCVWHMSSPSHPGGIGYCTNP